MSHHSPPLSVKTRNLIIPERKEDKSEDTSVQSVPLSIETGIVINSDSLEKIQDMSMYSAPFNVEAYSDSFEYSNERK